MNIEKININNIIDNKNINKKLILEKDDILSGEIKSLNKEDYLIKLNDNIHININKKFINGNIGDTIYFKVQDNKNTLKQISNDEEINITGTYNITKKLEPEKNIQSSNKQYRLFLDKNRQANIKENYLYSNNVKNKISHLSNVISKDNIQKIINEAINPKKFDLITMSDYLSTSTGVDLEKKPEEKTLIELREDKKKHMKMDLNMNGIDEEDLFSFGEILTNAGLPMTDKNLSSLSNVKDKIEQIDKIDKNSILNIIKNEKNITLDNLYTYKYANFTNKNNIDINNIPNINEQIENILKENDIQVNDENISISKDFIENGIDITYNNIDKFNKLNNIKNEINIENILYKATNNILKNESLLNINIINNENITEKYNKYVKVLNEISPEHIQDLLDKKIKINLDNLSLNYSNINTKNIVPSEESLNERLNLYKIQLKLTSDAMYSLYEKGINIDTKPLKEVINDLENIEQEKYKKYLEISKTTATNENLKIMSKTFSTIQNLYPNTLYNTFKDIIDEKVDFSLSGINKSLKIQNILNDFDTFKTLPNKSFGDNINKLENNFKDFLEKNEFEPNKDNIKALKILSLNGIDFTDENILKIKLINSKLDYISDNLSPMTVAKMLKENFNPMEKNIDDIIEYIDNNSFYQTSREKIAEQILDIDKENKLSNEERMGIISVYRMLNVVQKGDNVSIGNLLKSEKNITFKNLLEASKIYNKNKKNIDFDVKVDNKIGESEKIIPDNNISNSIKKGIEKANENYNKFILNQIINYATPDKINKLDFKQANIENILDTLKDNNKITLSSKSKEDFVKSIQNIDKNVLEYLMKNNLSITINNMEIMKDIINKNHKPVKNIDDFKNELEKRNMSFGKSIISIDDNQTINKETFTDYISFLKEENNEIFDEIINLNNLDDIKYMILKNKNVSSSLNFMADTNNISNGTYNMPIKLSNGKITDFNVLILNDSALNDKNLNLYLNFENENNNYIQAYIKVTNKGNLIEISSKNDAKKYESNIIDILKKLDISPTRIIYSISNDKNLYDNDDIEDIKQNLYNLGDKFLDNNFNMEFPFYQFRNKAYDALVSFDLARYVKVIMEFVKENEEFMLTKKQALEFLIILSIVSPNLAESLHYKYFSSKQLLIDYGWVL